tara:strand:+ start:14331 stop:15773 length:1443 start_codon:yes stop_codon:yes gene_type:complete
MTNNPKDIVARTGRVQTWIDNPKSRLPVSCTVFVVEDSMEGPDGIEASWRFVSHAIRYGAGVSVHLSKLRPNGTDNGQGLIASGPVTSGKIYSALNEYLRRGGHYRNGAVVLTLDISHPDILEFINMPRHELPWAKRCINLTEKLWKDTPENIKDAIIKGISRGDIWLAKIKYDQKGQRIYSNVCLEVFLKHRGTCLLQHVNLGACRPEDIRSAFLAGMNELISLHDKTGVEKTGYYLTPSDDRQVGLGMIGLANLLALEKVTYSEFAEALRFHLYPDEDCIVTPKATKIVKALQDGIDAAAELARTSNMDRAFAIAPTASCSYRYQDRAGYTTAPEIAPPIGRYVDRDSSTFGVGSYDYGEIETAESVGWDVYKRTADGIMEMLNRTELAHGYSFNSWSDVVVYDESFVINWLQSPQTSLYYSLQVMQNTQAKDDAMAALDQQYDFTFAENDDDLNQSENSHISQFAEVFNSGCVGCAE